MKKILLVVLALGLFAMLGFGSFPLWSIVFWLWIWFGIAILALLIWGYLKTKKVLSGTKKVESYTWHPTTPAPAARPAPPATPTTNLPPPPTQPKKEKKMNNKSNVILICVAIVAILLGYTYLTVGPDILRATADLLDTVWQAIKCLFGIAVVCVIFWGLWKTGLFK